MTEYELASLFAQITDNIAGQFTNYLTIISLYLGAGYLVAHRLALSSAISFTGIFLLINLGLVTVTVNSVRSWVGVAREIRTLAEQGKGFAWHSASTMPDWAPALMPLTTAILMAGIVAGAVSFFFTSRRRNLKLESQPAQASI